MQGDSGGPLIYNNNNTEPNTLIGIVAGIYRGWFRLFFSYEVNI